MATGPESVRASKLSSGLESGKFKLLNLVFLSFLLRPRPWRRRRRSEAALWPTGVQSAAAAVRRLGRECVSLWIELSCSSMLRRNLCQVQLGFRAWSSSRTAGSHINLVSSWILIGRLSGFSIRAKSAEMKRKQARLQEEMLERVETQ